MTAEEEVALDLLADQCRRAAVEETAAGVAAGIRRALAGEDG